MKAKEINGVRVMSSYVPKDRPTYDKWYKKMKCGPRNYFEDSEGKERADLIMESVGKNINPKSNFDRFIGALIGS